MNEWSGQSSPSLKGEAGIMFASSYSLGCLFLLIHVYRCWCLKQQVTHVLFGQEMEKRGLVMDTYPNAVREVCFFSSKQNDFDGPQLAVLEKAFAQDGVVLRSLGNGGFLHEVKSGYENHRGATLRRLSEINNTVAIADGATIGFGAALVSACQWRVATPRTRFALTQVRTGLCPDAPSLRMLKHCQPKVLRLWLALTGSSLGGTDCTEAGLATHFVSDPASGGLFDQLRLAPKEHFDLVLDRNCVSPPPQHLASPIQKSPQVEAALERALFTSGNSLVDVLDGLYKEQHLATSALQSCAWHTRELAEEVSDVLHDGIEAIHSSPALALQTTFLLLTNPSFDVFYSENDLDILVTALNRRLVALSASETGKRRIKINDASFSRDRLIEAQHLASDLIQDTLHSTHLDRRLIKEQSGRES